MTISISAQLTVRFGCRIDIWLDYRSSFKRSAKYFH